MFKSRRLRRGSANSGASGECCSVAGWWCSAWQSFWCLLCWPSSRPWSRLTSRTLRSWTRVLVGPSSQHLLGTDYLGRDTLSRLIYGARSSALVALVALGIATFIGMGAGLVAAYFGGIINAVIMRIVDALMAFPLILLALIIAALLGGGIKNVMIALGWLCFQLTRV